MRALSLRVPRGEQMRAWIGIAVVVAIGLMWSIAAISKWVPVPGPEMLSEPRELAAERQERELLTRLR